MDLTTPASGSSPTSASWMSRKGLLEPTLSRLTELVCQCLFMLPHLTEGLKVILESQPAVAGRTLGELQFKVLALEKERVVQAKEKLATVKAEHANLTRVWARADDRMQSVLRQDLDELGRQMDDWERLSVSFVDRLWETEQAILSRIKEIGELSASWPTLEGSRKGESLQQIFRRVRFFWEPTGKTEGRQPRFRVCRTEFDFSPDLEQPC